MPRRPDAGRHRKGRRYRVIWTESAVRDLEEIAAYFRHDSPSAARAFRDRIVNAGTSLQSLPERGRVVPELRDVGITAWRELILQPYRLLYQLKGTTVVVYVVIDSRRDVANLLFERLIRDDG
jgi:toxin ParE1/3/4